MKIVRRNKVTRFLLRLKIAYKLVFQTKHGILLRIDRSQLEGLITGKPIGAVKVSYFGMMEHQMAETIKTCSDGLDDIEIICSKAEFDAYVETDLKEKAALRKS